jgi:hypothetical protein
MAKGYLMTQEKVIGKRFGRIVGCRKRKGIHEYRIQWNGFSWAHWCRMPRLERRKFWDRLQGHVI